MGRVSLRAFRDVAGGSVGCETAPAGVLLVVAAGDPYRVGIGDRPLAAMPGGFLLGAQSHYGRSALGGTASGVQVDLPWSVAVRVFGSLLADLAEGTAPVAELPGARNLADQVADAGSVRPVVGWLRGLTRSPGAESSGTPAPLAVRALERIEAGATGVGQLAVELDCSRGPPASHRQVGHGAAAVDADPGRPDPSADRHRVARTRRNARRHGRPGRLCRPGPPVPRRASAGRTYGGGSCSAAGDISTRRASRARLASGSDPGAWAPAREENRYDRPDRATAECETRCAAGLSGSGRARGTRPGPG